VDDYTHQPQTACHHQWPPPISSSQSACQAVPSTPNILVSALLLLHAQSIVVCPSNFPLWGRPVSERCRHSRASQLCEFHFSTCPEIASFSFHLRSGCIFLCRWCVHHHHISSSVVRYLFRLSHTKFEVNLITESQLGRWQSALFHDHTFATCERSLLWKISHQWLRFCCLIGT